MNQKQIKTPTEAEKSEPTNVTADATSHTEPILETRPTVRPTLIWLTVAALVGGSSVGYFMSAPTTLGNPENTEIAANIILLLTIGVVVRLGVRLYVLTRTRYVVTTDAVRREYALFYKTFSRELPLSMMRSHELRRSRVETLLGIGSVAFLTGAVTQSPTHIEFEHISNPHEARERVREQLDNLT